MHLVSFLAGTASTGSFRFLGLHQAWHHAQFFPHTVRKGVCAPERPRETGPAAKGRGTGKAAIDLVNRSRGDGPALSHGRVKVDAQFNRRLVLSAIRGWL